MQTLYVRLAPSLIAIIELLLMIAAALLILRSQWREPIRIIQISIS